LPVAALRTGARRNEVAHPGLHRVDGDDVLVLGSVLVVVHLHDEELAALELLVLLRGDHAAQYLADEHVSLAPSRARG